MQHLVAQPAALTTPAHKHCSHTPFFESPSAALSHAASIGVMYANRPGDTTFPSWLTEWRHLDLRVCSFADGTQHGRTTLTYKCVCFFSVGT